MTHAVERADLAAPAEVRWIARELETAGFAAWAVGGAVRDALSGRAPGDWDFATSARPSDVRRIFRRTAPIGIEHGTVGVIGRSGKMYEVTTFRRDVETFGRRARVSFADSLEEDLERRDFTINAVAWHPLTGDVRDPHGGMRDLREGVLRTVGDPNLRFAEDRLRILRALRFAGGLTLRIDEATWTAVVASSRKLDHLSAERIREELWKVLSGSRYPSRTLELYAQSGVLASLYPELEECRGIPAERAEGALWRDILAATDAGKRSRPLIRLATLLHAVGCGRRGVPVQPDDATAAQASAAIARKVLRRLRMSNAETDRITHLVAQHAPVPDPTSPDPELRRWVRRVGREHIRDLFRLLFALCRAERHDPDRQRFLSELHRRTFTILREHPALSAADLAITGADLRAAGIPPGPRYGEILRDLLERVTDRPELNTRSALLQMVDELGEG